MSVASPTPRTKFLFMHLADPNKAPVKGEGRRRSEVGRMLRRPAGQEDLGDFNGAEIDPVLRNILGFGGGGDGGGGEGMAGEDGEDGVEDDGGEDDGGEEDEVDDEDGQGADEEFDDEQEDTSDDEGSGSRMGSGRGNGGVSGSRNVSRMQKGLRHGSSSRHSAPRGMRRVWGSRHFDDENSRMSSPLRGGPARFELDRRILSAAGIHATGTISSSASAPKTLALFGNSRSHGSSHDSPAPAASQERSEVHGMSYSSKRAALKEDREKKIEKRMLEMVHKGSMPPELLLDEELARGSKMDADTFEGDPDAYDTDELLGSDVSSISSTDEENDSEEVCARRDRRRAKRRSKKSKLLRKRKRDAWAKKRRDIELAKSRYYDDMIDQLVLDNPALRPPHVSADLETKRSFVDRATAENMTRSKIEQMARWIRLVAVVVENLGMISGFLMLDGLSSAIDQELRKPEMQPIIAQLARKYLRRGPSSPEWALAIMFLGSVGTIHAINVRSHEAQQATAGNGSATGPSSSKFGKFFAGATKIAKAMGFFGSGNESGAHESGGSIAEQERLAAARNVNARYTPTALHLPQKQLHQALPTPIPSRKPSSLAPGPPPVRAQRPTSADDDDDDDDDSQEISLNAPPWNQ